MIQSKFINNKNNLQTISQL